MRLALIGLLGLLAAAMSAHAAPPLGEGDKKLQRKIEIALGRQDEMVASALARLEPQRPGVRDVYFVGVAGWGDQDVFRKEVRAVRAFFETKMGAAKRAVSLVNHAATMDIVPLATERTIEATVMGLAKVMDPQEDLLVLFLTSHGAEWDGFSLALNGQEFGRLRTAPFARMLGASLIRNRVVVVSSCFSGQFIPALAEENTLLMTAAASDRPSFGCSATAEWTYFGEAFFRQALPKHMKFAPAFEDAVKRIEQRERQDGFQPSNPQIRVGEAIRPVLDELGF